MDTEKFCYAHTPLAWILYEIMNYMINFFSVIIYKIKTIYYIIPYNIKILLYFCFILLTILLIILSIIIYYRNVKFVKENSIRYKSLIELNKKFHFIEIENTHYVSNRVKQLSSLRAFNIEKKMIEEIMFHKDFYHSLIFSSIDNRNNWLSYQNNIEKLPPYMIQLESFNTRISKKRFNKIEKRLNKKNIMKAPVFEPKVVYRVSYTSPAGRNSYSRKWEIPFCNIQFYYDTVERKIEYQHTGKYERQKLTASLRYDILKRDNFKCKLCGRSARDGVELEVDHIIPISKGGKTIESNLRVLCKDCNRGKSDKL